MVGILFAGPDEINAVKEHSHTKKQKLHEGDLDQRLARIDGLIKLRFLAAHHREGPPRGTNGSDTAHEESQLGRRRGAQAGWVDHVGNP